MSRYCPMKNKPCQDWNEEKETCTWPCIAVECRDRALLHLTTECNKAREWREKASKLLLSASALLRIWIDEAPAGSAIMSENILTHIDDLLTEIEKRPDNEPN